MSNNPFNTNNSNINPFNTNNSNTNPFNTNNTNNSNNNLFNTNNSNVNSSNVNNNNSSNNLFGNTETNKSNLFGNTGSVTSSVDNLKNLTDGNAVKDNASNTSLFSNDNKSRETILDSNQTQINKSGIITSIQDSSLNLYNLTVKEIIEKQSQILDKNIQEFESSVKDVFEQDMKLIAAKTNYLKVQNKIKVNTTRINELMEGLDFFQKELEKKLEAQEKEMEKVDFESSRLQTTETLNDFEVVCDNFYEKIENFNDENQGVMDLINENYEYVEKIDALLDNLSYKAGL
ncbi:hypothetical protein EHP00_1655 [Ecytonucleospora hepatopenaei]|uniref:Uncharacterized protein n=1 Tax=Ecytonucleospora hepatopenaei TaxID=646526 RepID=A0A1W0E813_9MICR|nr:hypothetical protein EHP00_1655 [Ecytonucleospora hepatopenaei]